MRSAVVTFLLLLTLAACSEGPFSPVTEAEEQEIKVAIAGRSFRQFDPSKDGSPRKGVIIHFFSGVGLWAQYSEGGHALGKV